MSTRHHLATGLAELGADERAAVLPLFEFVRDVDGQIALVNHAWILSHDGYNADEISRRLRSAIRRDRQDMRRAGRADDVSETELAGGDDPLEVIASHQIARAWVRPPCSLGDSADAAMSVIDAARRAHRGIRNVQEGMRRRRQAEQAGQRAIPGIPGLDEVYKARLRARLLADDA